MRFLGWRLFITSIAVFFVNLLTLGNTNFITNATLQKIGQFVGVVAALSILINFAYLMVNMIGKMRKHSQEEWERKDPSQKRAIRIKRLVGFLIWIWLFFIFPLIAMYWMGLLSKVLESNQGSLVGTILFTIMVIIGTILPSIFFFSFKDLSHSTISFIILFCFF